MTPCEELGYKVGDKFEVIGQQHHMFSVGDVVLLTEDDGSDYPGFTKGSDYKSYIQIDRVKKMSNPEGWIEWKGGECPVEKGTLLDIKYRDGTIISGIEAITGHVESYSNTDWVDNEIERAIIAYRLSEQKKVDGDDFVPFDDSGRVESSIETKDYSLDIITLISSVAPNVSVSDALEIASTLQENVFKK